MAAIDEYSLAVIRCLAENKVQDAKRYAVAACINDTSKKNSGYVQRYKKLLENGPNMIELPGNIKGTLCMEDVSGFHSERYYVGPQQEKLLEQIKQGVAVTLQLREYGIPYRNSSIIYGVSGTGKTEFARYVAYTLGIPFAYVNFANLIDSRMGDTSKNINRIFDFCKGQKCVLLLDEIDCIGLKRGASEDGGPSGELARTTISLMQALDDLTDGQIIIAATNRFDRLDPAIIRRFQRCVEFLPFEKDDRVEMVKKYMNNVNPEFLTEDVLSYADENHTQAEITSFLIDAVIDRVSENIDVEAALVEYTSEINEEQFFH